MNTQRFELRNDQIVGGNCKYCDCAVKTGSSGGYHHNDYEAWKYCNCDHMRTVADAREDANLLGEQKHQADQLVRRLEAIVPAAIDKSRKIAEALRTANNLGISPEELVKALEQQPCHK